MHRLSKNSKKRRTYSAKKSTKWSSLSKQRQLPMYTMHFSRTIKQRRINYWLRLERAEIACNWSLRKSTACLRLRSKKAKIRIRKTKKSSPRSSKRSKRRGGTSKTRSRMTSRSFWPSMRPSKRSTQRRRSSTKSRSKNLRSASKLSRRTKLN